MKRIRLINTNVDSVSLDEVVDHVFHAIERKSKVHIVFLNALKICEIEKDTRLAQAVAESDMILADGVPIVWASRLFGRPLPGRVNGTDLFERLLKGSEEKKRRIFLLGTTQKNLDILVEKLRQDYPRLEIAGARNGYFGEGDDEEIISGINASGADILFLGFGSPKKELWANKYKDRITVPIIQGVGGSFDVVAGLIPRAPLWMQRNGLEWLNRIFKEPRRMLGRYLITNSMFLWLLAGALVKEKLLRTSP